VSDVLANHVDVAAVLRQAAETNLQLMAAIEQMQAPAALGLAVMEDDGCYQFAEAAKLLAPRIKEKTGVEVGQNRLFEALRTMRILQSTQAHWNEPYQEYVHHFKLVLKNNPHVGIKTVTLVTGKGLAWVLQKLVEYYK